MKKIYLKIVIIILYITYSCNNANVSLPDKYECKKLATYNSSTDIVEKFSIDLGKFSESDLFNYSIKCCKECLTDNWVRIDIEIEEHKLIFEIVSETSMLIQSDGLNELLKAFSDSSTIYFSSCYTKENPIDEFKYYEQMFILDKDHSKFYQFKLIKGSIFSPA